MNTWRVQALGAYAAEAREPATALKPLLRNHLPKPPRRINRYIRLALIGAHRCVERFDGALAADTPLYLASEQGSVAEAVDLMDEIVVHGRSPMPMPFINVSSNMVGYYLAASLGLSGRNMTVARHRDAFGAMLELAALESAVDACTPSTLLLGSVAECVWPLAQHRRRCRLPADVPLIEGSHWLLVDDEPDDGHPRLCHARTRDAATAQAWLAAGEHWALDPRLSGDEQRMLGAGLQSGRAWHAPYCHAGYPDAVVHALFTALETRPTLRLHVVTGSAATGYQLMGVC